MATVKVTLSLSSVDVLTSPLNLSVTSNLRADSGSLIRAKVKGTSVGEDDLAIYIVNQALDRAYLYIKNLETELENYIYIHNGTDDGLVAKVGGGEFAFIPVAVDKKYTVYSTVVDTMIEYGIFGNDNSAAPYGGS